MTVNMKIQTSITFALFLLISTSGASHECWLEPNTFFLKSRESVPIRLYVGDGLRKDLEEIPYQADRTTTFRQINVANEIDIERVINNGARPILTFSSTSVGNPMLVMERNWSYVELDAKKFEDYVEEVGMHYIIEERLKRGETLTPGRERYRRSIKTLLQVGDKRDDTYNKVTGVKLEIIPLSNPYAKKNGGHLVFQAFFNGKPLANKIAFAENRTSTTQSMVTDAEGKFSMKIDRAGLWLVRLVYMQRCTEDCGTADWESYWGTYTFGVK